MKTTKDKILNTALSLFNQYGLAKVTLRAIAREVGMSQGNLNYHFKKRDDIIEVLYFQLVDNIDESISNSQSKEMGLYLLFDLSTTIMNNFYDYRFFLLDFVQIMRENATIKTHYLKLTALRKDQFMALFHLMIKEGILRQEELPNEYLFLYNRFQILGNFWISSAEVLNERISQTTMTEYTAIINQAIYPYLTAVGKEAYSVLEDSVVNKKGN